MRASASLLKILFLLAAATGSVACHKGGAPALAGSGGVPGSPGSGGKGEGGPGGAVPPDSGASAMGGGGAGGGAAPGVGGAAGALVDPSDAGADDPGQSGDTGGAGGAGNPIIEAFAGQARAIANDYKAWGRVDDEWRWAPFLCRLPLPAIARVSGSDDPSTHGQKLYSVFAKNHDAYPNGPHTDQVVVKESWIPELVSDAGADFSPGTPRYAADAGDHFYGFAKGDGGVYRAGTFAGLYIMFKVAATPDTDEGWVYATITAGGEVTAAGRVASCMGCHEDAQHERLFGVPLSATVP
ncbi:MAG TPA: hypothetical protein VIU64_19550 [Polyangia bacterium]